MSRLATVVIPYADYHAGLLSRAVRSAEVQTVPVEIVTVRDELGRGAGWGRNQGSQNATTDFVVWLDADDELHPQFVERTISHYKRGQYVYTAWTEGRTTRKPSACNPFSNGGVHLVTTLYPTAIFNALQGFDQNLIGNEDTDFYLKSARYGVCGVYLDEVLVYYSGDGKRSKDFIASDDYDTVRKLVYERNGGYNTIMGCCGNSGPMAVLSAGERQEGDVLAQATWAGIRTESSFFAHRIYRGGNGSEIWVDPRDIHARPDLYRQVVNIVDSAPDVEYVQMLAAQAVAR
jgi:glycosyltransferase involved in cell wall biosynthesis